MHAALPPNSDMSLEGGDVSADLNSRDDSRETLRNTVEPQHDDAPKCKRCDQVADEDCCDHCKDCFEKLKLAQRTMNLATGDTS